MLLIILYLLFTFTKVSRLVLSAWTPPCTQTNSLCGKLSNLLILLKIINRFVLIMTKHPSDKRIFLILTRFPTSDVTKPHTCLWGQST